MDFITVDDIRRIANEMDMDEDDIILYLLDKYNEAVQALKLLSK